MNTLNKALNLLTDVYKQQDWLATMLETYRASPVCVLGCGRCEQIFHCYDIEAKLIANQIGTLRKDQRKRVIQQLEAWLLTEPREPGLTDEKLFEIVKQMCPFAGDDFRCLIYPWRPVNCRAWGITRTAPSWCLRPIVAGETETKRMSVAGPELNKLQAMIDNLIKYMKENAPSLMTIGFMPGLVYRNLNPKFDKKFAGVKLSMGVYQKDVSPWIITDQNAKDKGIEGGELDERIAKDEWYRNRAYAVPQLR